MLMLLHALNKRDLSNKKRDNRRREKRDPSSEYIDYICQLYDDVYDDREEDSKPGGEDWRPGEKADHTSLECFRKKLKDSYGIDISTVKIRKILFTGGCWTTERSREVAELYKKYGNAKRVAEILEVSESLVKMYLPYEKTVYDLADKSGNAKRVERWRERQAGGDGDVEMRGNALSVRL